MGTHFYLDNLSDSYRFYGYEIIEGKMKKLSMILPLALILCFMVSCQNKEAMAELEAMKAKAEVGEQLPTLPFTLTDRSIHMIRKTHLLFL